MSRFSGVVKGNGWRADSLCTIHNRYELGIESIDAVSLDSEDARNQGLAGLNSGKPKL